MRGKLKKLLSLFCVLTLLFASTGILPSLALESTEGLDSAAPEDVGREESGLFIMTGLDEPEDIPAEVSMSVPGQDAHSDSETVSQPRDSLPALPGLASGSSVITPDAVPSIQVSKTRVSKRTGETETVTVTVGGYPSGAYLQASNSNSRAFSCIWGDWNGFGIPLRITGRASGGGEIRLSLKNTNNQELAYTIIQVTVVAETPTLTVSPSNLSVNVGESARATLTLNHYSGGGSLSASVADSSVCSTRWGSWSGSSVPITVTGRASGTTRVTVRLYNSARTELASVTLNVEVNPSTTLTASPASVSVYAGESAVVTVSPDSALANGDSFRYSTSNSARFSVSSNGTSGNSIRLVVTGRSEGSGTLTVSLNNQSGVQVAIPVTVRARPENERVTVAASSVTLDVGQSTKVTCTAQNVSGLCAMRCINNTPSVLDCAWRDNWSNRSVPITITGRASGTGSVTIALVVGDVVRSTATIQVTVRASAPTPSPDPTPSPTPSTSPPSYSFSNYSKPGISLALCRYMFGDNQRARTVYYYDVGNGGVCFGMATTAGLLSGTNAPNTSVFGKSSIRDLRKSDYSTTLDPRMGLSLTDFIEAMHISQVASNMRELAGVQNLVSEARRGGTSRPVIVCLRGREGGHAILAYGVTASGALRVYDSNYPAQERTIPVSGENWSYDISPRIRWNQSNGQISYIPYDTYYSVWNNHRGSLNATALQDGDSSSRYLLATTADNFALRVFDANYEAPDGEEPYQRQVAVYADGVLQPGHDEDIEEVFVSNITPDSEEPSHLHMLYVPGEELYTVHNANFVDGRRMMDVTLSGNGLSVHVNSAAEKFVLAVSDEERFATAMLNGLREGEYYSLSVGSSLDGDSENSVNNANIEGYGNGQAICLGIGDGLGMLGLNNSEGLCVAGGGTGRNDFSSLSALSLNAMENEAPDAPRPFAQDFALNSARSDTEYPLTAQAGAGGRILPQDGQPAESVSASVPENGNYTFRIQPDDGYTLKAVYVNGVQAAYADAGSASPTYSYYNGAYEYTFRDVTQPGFLYAEFARDMSACQVSGNPESGVTVTDGDRTLREGVDYTWSVSENHLVAQALPDSDYSGVSMTLYEASTPSAPSLIVNSHNANEINLTVRGAANSVILAAAYSLDGSQSGKMLTLLPPAELSGDTGDGIPARIPLAGAALPEHCLVRVFLLSDTDSMRVLCAPAEFPIYSGGGGGGAYTPPPSGGGSSSGGGGAYTPPPPANR